MADDPEDSEAAELIGREYQMLRAVNGTPYFPQIIGHYAGQAALAVTWIEGATLTDLIQARADRLVDINITTSIDILVELAEALRRLHAAAPSGQPPLLHGHLGCQRVTLSVDGDVYVTGLGVRPRGRLPAYTAPEQAAGAFIDWRTDQWALGAIGVELILGERLYTGTETPSASAREGVVRLWIERIGRQWPPIGRVLRRTLAPAAGDRYQSNDELVHDLMAARRTAGGLSQRRGLARKVTALRQRLSVQRPPATPIDPRQDPAPEVPAQPRPVSPPKNAPVIVVNEETPYSPPPKPRQPYATTAPLPRMPTPVAPVFESDHAMSDLFGPMPGDPPPREDPAALLPAVGIALEPGEELEPTELSAPPRRSGEDIEDDDTPASAVALQPSELAGMFFAILFAILSLFYLFTRLWV
jgi:serine/threonine protein kinase